MSEPEQDAPPAKKGFSLSMPKLSAPALPKIPNLPGLIGKPSEEFGDKSLRECIMPPHKLQSVPDVDENTQKYYDDVKPALDMYVIQPYKDLGTDLPQILADGFRQFFDKNERYKEFICTCVGNSVGLNMGYVIKSNSKAFQDLLNGVKKGGKSGGQRGGSTCSGSPPFDISSLFGRPTYGTQEQQQPTIGTNEKVSANKKAVSNSLKDTMIKRFSKEKGATFSDINAHIEYLLYTIFRTYDKYYPHTKEIRKLIDRDINTTVANAILTYIGDVQKGGGKEDPPEIPGEMTEEKGGPPPEEAKPEEATPEEATTEEAKPKSGFLSGFANSMKNKASAASKKMGEKANSAKEGLKSFAKNPLGAMSSFAKSAFSKQSDPNCKANNESLLESDPATYNWYKITMMCDRYVGQSINSILCTHEPTLKQLCNGVVKYHLYEYLKTVDSEGPLFKFTKNAYIYCIAKFCEQLPEDIAFKMIYKYIFKDNWSSVFMTNFLEPDFGFEQLVKSNSPFEVVKFEFKSEKKITDIQAPIITDASKTKDSAQLKYTFNSEKFNAEIKIPLIEIISTMIKSGTGTTVTYGLTPALPTLAFKHLVEVTKNGILQQDVMEPIVTLFNESIYRSVDAVNTQFITDIGNNTLITTMCKYLISKHSITSKLIESAMKSYNDMYNVVVTSDTKKAEANQKQLQQLKGFYLYHSFRHMIDRSLNQHDFNTIYSDYMKIIPTSSEGQNVMNWQDHPFHGIFSVHLTNLYSSMLALVGKVYSNTWVSEYPTFRLGGANRRKTRRPKHPILKKRRKTRRPRKPVGRRFSRKLSNKKKYTR